MKLAKQTDNEMVFERKRSMFWFIFGLFLSGIPLISFFSVIYNTLYNTEITNLDCQRITSNLVNCQKKQSKFFGLLPASVTSFARITKAEYNGNWVNLVDNEGRKNNILSLNNFTGNRERMRNSAERINNFINSNVATFAITTRQDFSWEEILWSSFWVFLYAVPGGVLMYLSLISETWIFDKSSGLFIHNKTLPLLGTRTFFTESLINFQELQIIQTHTATNDYYQLKFLFKSNIIYDIIRYNIFGITGFLPKVEEVAITLGDFLQISINKTIKTPDMSMKLVKQTTNEMVFERKKSIFLVIHGLLMSGMSLVLLLLAYASAEVLAIFMIVPFFLLPGVFLTYSSLISETWIFGKSSGLFTHQKTLPLLGIKTLFTESLINFQELQIIETTDSDGSQNYTLKLLLKSTNRHEFLSYHYLPKIEEVAINLGDFLQISVNKIMLDKVNETEKDLN